MSRWCRSLPGGLQRIVLSIDAFTKDLPMVVLLRLGICCSTSGVHIYDIIHCPTTHRQGSSMQSREDQRLQSLLHICRVLQPGEQRLNAEEQALLDRICEAYYLPAWCSIDDYKKLFGE